MAFAFYSFTIAAVAAVGGTAFASDDSPAWTTKTQVRVHIETGVPAKTAKPPVQPAGTPASPEPPTATVPVTPV